MEEMRTLVTDEVEFEYVDETVSTVHYGTFGLSKMWGKEQNENTSACVCSSLLSDALIKNLKLWLQRIMGLKNEKNGNH